MTAIPAWSDLIGTEWTPEFDCWGLVRLVYQRELDIELPVIEIQHSSPVALVRAFETHPTRERFEPVETPQMFDMVEFRHPDGLMLHIGVFVDIPDGQFVLHNDEKSGVVLDNPHAIHSELRYWRYRVG